MVRDRNPKNRSGGKFPPFPRTFPQCRLHWWDEFRLDRTPHLRHNAVAKKALSKDVFKFASVFHCCSGASISARLFIECFCDGSLV